MKYNAEQVAFMLHEAIDQNREYKSWHVSTQHLMTLVERVVAEEREACAKVCDETYYSVQAADAIRARGNVATNDTSQERVDETSESVHEPVETIDSLEQEIYENTRQFVSRDVMEWMLKRYYTAPPQRTWVGLTDDEIEQMGLSNYIKVVRETEAKLKEKNT